MQVPKEARREGQISWSCCVWQAIVNHQTWVLKPKLRSSGKSIKLSSSLNWFFFNLCVYVWVCCVCVTGLSSVEQAYLTAEIMDHIPSYLPSCFCFLFLFDTGSHVDCASHKLTSSQKMTLNFWLCPHLPSAGIISGYHLTSQNLF